MAWKYANILLLIFIFISHTVSLLADQYVPIREATFNDPNTHYQYKVVSYNITPMTTISTYRSSIKISRVKLDDKTLTPIGRPEAIQTIDYHPTLVDFDLNCQHTHCYLVTVTSRSKQNLRLYAWRRTQFDILAEKDTFARPHSVKMFRIRSEFYIVVAQDQLHLSSIKLAHEDTFEEPRFLGCAVLKFKRNDEHNIRYHQFIKLPFNPLYVHHFVSFNSHANSVQPNQKLPENHFLVFSTQRNWTEHSAEQAYSFIWSSLDNYFWPYRLPRNIVYDKPVPGSLHKVITIPKELAQANLSRSQTNAHFEPVESCFHQLQGILAYREEKSRRWIEYGQSLWRSALVQQRRFGEPNLVTNISPQVIVHGDVIVKGSLLDAPRISLIGYQQPNAVADVKSHSPIIVENTLAQALSKLKLIRDKLSKAVYSDLSGSPIFKSHIRFFGRLDAERVIFDQSGISNSDVRLNGIPFAQLEHELVGLKGSQDIPSKVIFSGNVVADILEVHSLINERYHLADAVDIHSNQVQVIEVPTLISSPYQPKTPFLEFYSVEVPELSINRSNTINGILLDDIITRDNRSQVVTGHKWFKNLAMYNLNLANPSVSLNGFNISQMASNAINLRGLPYQRLSGKNSFSRPVRVKKLFINGYINKYINVTSLIIDSIKSYETRPQHIYGHKRFLSGLRMGNLDTRGSINGINPRQVFNINPVLSANASHMNDPEYNTLKGTYIFEASVECLGSLNVRSINEVDVFNRAIRRVSHSPSNIQIVRGKKIFRRPITVINQVQLSDPHYYPGYNNATKSLRPYPLVNGIDIRSINQGLTRQMQSPRTVYIDNLVIRGNLNLNLTSPYSKSTFGTFPTCPLDAIRSKFILAGGEEQTIDVPFRVNSLRGSVVYVDPEGLNGISFPGDFVLRHNRHGGVEPIYGPKSFKEVIIRPPSSRHNAHKYATPNHQPFWSSYPSVTFGQQSSINNLTQQELHTFVSYERMRNSTGEKLLQTLDVYGDIYAHRINGYRWPDDILLKGVASRAGPVTAPYMHKRIYSPLVFVDQYGLQVENQLVLRGPIHLRGRLNGVNLTDFARQSVTLGDKDLLSGDRGLSNKVFAGGLSVRSELRSQGLISGVKFDEMVSKVVTTLPGQEFHITGPKSFISDVDFLSHVNMMYLNGLPLDNFLRRVRLEPGNVIRLFGKKTISGTLRINKLLEVQGLINNIDFVDLKAHAIPLNPPGGGLVFNKTLTVEGDVFIDNLIINEKEGVIDGVKLVNLLPVDPATQNEIVLANARIGRESTNGNIVRIYGSVQDCQVTCSLAPQYQSMTPMSSSPLSTRPSEYYESRPIQINGTTASYLRSTPPYATNHLAQSARLYRRSTLAYINHNNARNSMSSQRTIAVQYERVPHMIREEYLIQSPQIAQQIEVLRRRIVCMALDKPQGLNRYVIGFIETDSNDIGAYQLIEEDPPHSDHFFHMPSFLPLDQTDFPFRPTTYHLSVGILTDMKGPNVTCVFSSIGGQPPKQLTVLPVEAPNNAMFLKLPHEHGLFLLVSQDYSVSDRCPAHTDTYTYSPRNDISPIQTRQIQGGVHVYLFHALFNSSSLTAAYFDLYQTIDLAAVDSFEYFVHNGSAYVLAVSRALNKIHLLLLRGYSGFQVVSYLDVPLLERVKVINSPDRSPAIIVYLTNGLHKLMESVII